MAIIIPSAHTYGAGFPVDGVAFTSATLMGWIVRNGGEACQYRFRYKVAGGSYSYTDWTGSVEGEGDGDGYFGETIDVDSRLVYYFNAQARNSAGESDWGPERALARPHGIQREWDYTPKQGAIFNVAHGAASPFSGVINGEPTATSVVYDGESNENCLKGLGTGATRWGRFVLHNTTRSNSRLVTDFDETINKIYTEASADDWANNDVITLQSQTCAQAGYMDVDLSNELDSDEVVAYIQFEALDKSGDAVAGRRYVIHPFEAYEAGKRLMCPAALGNEFTAVSGLVPINSQKLCVFFQGFTDFTPQISVLATLKYNDT